MVHSLEEALQHCKQENEIFVIGGASIFEQALRCADRIYLTRIHHDFEGDTFLFDLDKRIWRETSREEFQPDSENPYPYSFLTFERK